MTRTNLPARRPSRIYDDPRQFRPKLEVLDSKRASEPQAQYLTPGSTFQLFPNLPLELRLKIWELTLPGPRLVIITTLSSRSFTSPTPVPVTLHVCSDSRSVALRRYSLHFARQNTCFGPQIYFNFHDDVVYLRHDGTDLSTARSLPSVFANGIAASERAKIRAVCWDMNILPKILTARTDTNAGETENPWKDVQRIYVSMESEAPPLDPRESCEMWELEKKDFGRFEDMLSGRAAARRRRICLNPGSFVVRRRLDTLREILGAHFWSGERVGKEVRFVVVGNEGKEPVDWRLEE